MKATKTIISTLREAPNDAVIASHQLMMRSGLIRKLGNGLYAYMPFGFRSLMKVEKIIREELDNAGLLEIKPTVIVPGDLWKESGRWDKMAGEELAKIAGVEVEELAIKMFEAGSNFAEKTVEEILNQDFKIFHAGDIAFGLDQVSAMGKKQLDEVKARLIPALDDMIAEKKIDMIFVMLTDILTESTDLICGGEGAREVASKAYPNATGDDSLWLEGVVSRKKQILPAIMNGE